MKPTKTRIIFVADTPEPEHFRDGSNGVWIYTKEHDCSVERLIATAKRMRPDIIRVISGDSIEDIIEWRGGYERRIKANKEV